MAYGLNKVQLIGNLGSDPELKQTNNGHTVTTFSVATNESYKDKDGNLVARTEWHRCVVWGKPAETLAKYLKKGSKVYLEGKLQTRSWDDESGNKRYMTEVVVNDFMFLSPADKSEGQGESHYTPQPVSTGKPADDLPF